MAVADPGFPVGGGGVPTSDMGAFRQKHMRKRMNCVLLGGGARAGGASPLDPPMYGSIFFTFKFECIFFII